MTTRSGRLTQRARERLAVGELLQAKTLAHAALLDGPELEALNTLATIEVRLGEPSRAELLFRRAIELEPTSHKPHANLATLLGNQGRLAEAIAHARRAAALAPEHPRFRVQLARWLSQAGALSEAEASLEGVDEAPGAEALLESLRASISTRRGALSAAREHLDAARARSASPELEAQLDDVRLRWAMHDLDDAAALAAELSRSEPASSSAMELDVLLRDARAPASSGRRAPSRRERFELIHGRARFVSSPASTAAIEPSRLAVTVWAHGVDEVPSLRRSLEALQAAGREVHVYAERPAYEHLEGAKLHASIDVSGWSHTRVASALRSLGASAYLDAAGAGPAGRSAVWSQVEQLSGLRTGPALGRNQGLGFSATALRAAPPGVTNDPQPRPDGAPHVLAGLDPAHRWTAQERRTLLESGASHVVMRGHPDDLSAVSSVLQRASGALELRVPITRPIDPQDLAGVDALICPGAGSICTALTALAAGVPVVAMPGGALTELLRSCGLDELLLREGEPLLDAVERAARTTRDHHDRIAGRLLLPPTEAGARLDRELGLGRPAVRAGSSALTTDDRVVETDAGLGVVVPNDLDNISTYVLVEQQRWFEDEVDFVDAILSEGDVVVDIGANHGAYALPMARRVGPTGKVRAFEPAHDTARRLRASAGLNGLEWLVVEQKALGEHPGTVTLSHGSSPELHQIGSGPGEQVEVRRLDDYALELGGLSFVKLDAEGFEEPILRGGRALLTTEQPVVMFELKHGSEVNHALIERFRELGFGCYVFVPALEALVPLELEAIDGFQLNLFAATEERAARLAARGRLFDGRVPAELAPDLEGASRWLRERGHAKSFGTQATPMIAWQLMAEDRSRPIGERRRAQLAALRLSFGEPSSEVGVCELLTRARILRGAGLRTRALSLLARARELLAARPAKLEPLLPVLPRFDALEPTLASEWLEAQALEASVRFQAYSSCFGGDEPIAWLLRLQELDYHADEMSRRLSLILERKRRLD